MIFFNVDPRIIIQCLVKKVWHFNLCGSYAAVHYILKYIFMLMWPKTFSVFSNVNSSCDSVMLYHVTEIHNVPGDI